MSRIKKIDPKIVASLIHHPAAKGRILLVGALQDVKKKDICSFSVQAHGSAISYILAPGYQILTSTTDQKTNYKASIRPVSGTSFATPIVSGCLMLLLSSTNWHPDEVISFLKTHGVMKMPKQQKNIDPVYGRGCLNLKNYFQKILEH